MQEARAGEGAAAPAPWPAAAEQGSGPGRQRQYCMAELHTSIIYRWEYYHKCGDEEAWIKVQSSGNSYKDVLGSVNICPLTMSGKTICRACRADANVCCHCSKFRLVEDQISRGCELASSVTAAAWCAAPPLLSGSVGTSAVAGPAASACLGAGSSEAGSCQKSTSQSAARCSCCCCCGRCCCCRTCRSSCC